MKVKTGFKCAVIILGVIVIPLLYSYFYLGAFWDPYNRLETVPVAVVNEDKGAEINGETRNLGKEAVDKIVDDGTMKFTVTSKDDAESGVSGNKYYAVIRFPSDFSAKIASANEVDKQVATLTYSANMKHNYICSQIMKNAVLTIEESSRDSVNKEIASTLTNKLNEVPDKMGDLSDGLGKLSDGAVTLSDGTSKIDENQNKLNNAIIKLNNGMTPIYSGSKTLNNGIATLCSALTQVADGTDQLSKGTAQLPQLVSALPRFGTGVNQLVAQTKTSGDPLNPTLYDGVTQLDGGLKLLNAQFSTTTNPSKPTLFDGTKALSGGLTQLNAQMSTSGDAAHPTIYDGVTGVAGGLTQLTNQFKTSGDESNPSLYDSVNALNNGTTQYVTSVNATIFAMIKNDPNSATMLSTYNSQLTAAKTAYASASTQAAKDQIMKEQIKPLANLVTIYSAALNTSDPNSFTTALVKAANDDAQNASLISSGSQITTGTQSLADQVNGGTLKTSIFTLAAGANQVAGQFSDTGAFKQGMAQATAGANSLYANVNGGDLSTNVAKLSGGATQLMTSYTGDYTKGINDLAAGMNAVLAKASDLGKLSTGVTKLNSAATQLQSGSTKLLNGSTDLTNGLKTVKNGTAQLADGSSQLAAATGKLNDGAQEIKDGINTAKDGVNDSITDANDELAKTKGLDTFAEKPVEVKEANINPLPNYGSAFAPYFMSLSLYVGALLMFFGIYLDADDRIKMLSRHSDKKIVRVVSFAGIGVAQAVALGLICQFALGLSIDNIPAFYGSCILISLVFISIVEFLIVNLKDVGKFLSIAFLVLQLTSCGGTFPMETTPELFRWLYPYMPMTYSVNLLKENTINFNFATVRYDVYVLIGIFVLFTGLTIVFSLTRKAKVKVQQIIEAQN